MLLNTTAPGATAPSFAAQQAFAIGSPESVSVADFNGDGKPDLAFANATGPVSVLLNMSRAIPISGSPATGTIQEDVDNPSSFTPVSGTTPQTATPSTAFATNLAVLVETQAATRCRG